MDAAKSIGGLPPDGNMKDAGLLNMMMEFFENHPGSFQTFMSILSGRLTETPTNANT